ncbi:MAG TPA: DUF4332 domain-containing protein [Anaerolineales bacterium]|nr:DUF4332 domain-containing protein [Anaerolineales bacterium]
MTRLQFEVSDERIQELDSLQKRTGIKTRIQLFNSALSLFEWAVRQRESGRIIASMDEEKGIYKELEMPGLPSPQQPELVPVDPRSTPQYQPASRQVTERPGVYSTVPTSSIFLRNLLKGSGVSSYQDLLEQVASPEGRSDVSRKLGVSESILLDWVNHVDLLRINGVGEEYADLLQSADVDTISELANQNSSELFRKLVKVNEEKRLVRRLPTEDQVENWIQHAKELPGIVTY